MDGRGSGSAHVIGMGEVGRRLADALERSGWTIRRVTREHGWEQAARREDACPRIVAVREEALAAVLDRLEAVPRERIVLVQNGFLEAVHGPLGPVGRGLIYFTSKGEFFRELCASPFAGASAVEIADALSRAGVAAEVLDETRFLEAMIVKGAWNAVVGLPLAVHGVDLATYLDERGGELVEVVRETTLAAGRHYSAEVAVDGAVAKIRETTRELGRVRGGAKALAWRNGAVAWFGRRHGVETPVNDRLLRAVGYDPDRGASSSRLPPS